MFQIIIIKHWKSPSFDRYIADTVWKVFITFTFIVKALIIRADF